MAPFPCIGHNTHLSLETTLNAHYNVVLDRLRAPGSTDTLLDLACMVGQLVRWLAAEGVDSSRLYGSDLEQGFLDIGYDLWRDKGRLKATFVAGDLLRDPDAPGVDALAALDGKLTIVHMQKFFHLLTWDDQVKGAKRILRFLKPGRTDHIVWGDQIGSVKPGVNPLPAAENEVTNRYLHDEASWQRLWDEVGAQTGTKWEARSELIPIPEAFLQWIADWPEKESFRILRFGVYRVA